MIRIGGQSEQVDILFLHGNHIATVTNKKVILFDGGWQSNTTKSRLNALCSFYCYKGEGVFQKNYKWYVRKFVGAINGTSVFKNDEFHSGYTFSENTEVTLNEV